MPSKMLPKRTSAHSSEWKDLPTYKFKLKIQYNEGVFTGWEWQFFENLFLCFFLYFYYSHSFIELSLSLSLLPPPGGIRDSIPPSPKHLIERMSPVRFEMSFRNFLKTFVFVMPIGRSSRGCRGRSTGATIGWDGASSSSASSSSGSRVDHHVGDDVGLFTAFGGNDDDAIVAISLVIRSRKVFVVDAWFHETIEVCVSIILSS